MRIRIKLTVLCDSDLLTLNSIPEFNFKKWVREALGTYASTGGVITIPLPDPPEMLDLKNIMLSITFDDKKDAAIVELLKPVQHRLRSSAVKTILRCSITHPCLYAHFQTLPPIVYPKKLEKPQFNDMLPGLDATTNYPEQKQAAPIPSVADTSDDDNLPEGFDIFTTEIKVR